MQIRTISLISRGLQRSPAKNLRLYCKNIIKSRSVRKSKQFASLQTAALRSYMSRITRQLPPRDQCVCKRKIFFSVVYIHIFSTYVKEIVLLVLCMYIDLCFVVYRLGLDRVRLVGQVMREYVLLIQSISSALIREIQPGILYTNANLNSKSIALKYILQQLLNSFCPLTYRTTIQAIQESLSKLFRPPAYSPIPTSRSKVSFIYRSISSTQKQT